MADHGYELTSPGDYREIKEDDIVLTRNGFDKLQGELDHLKNEKKWEVAKRLEEARAFGDLSENSEYEDAKQEQAFVQGRILEIESILENARLITEDEIDLSEATLGSAICIEDLERGEELRFRLVSSAEARGDGDCLSDLSPVGRAILGRKVGDIVEVEVPSGVIKYRILDIEI
ncbi:MAG: transcription elongation factor GreA [Actinomycetota bacterium]|nr:transcription elongation factor GreA [Actinomycetota bacterium]